MSTYDEITQPHIATIESDGRRYNVSVRVGYDGLRKATDEILAKIRYRNQVAISMRAGLLDVEGAAQEIDLTEKQLHALIDRLSVFAGVEE